MQTIALAIQKDDVADYILPDNCFVKGERLENFINAKVKYTTIDKFKIPSPCRLDIIFDLEMVAVDYYSKISFNYLRRPYLIIFNCNPLRLNPNSLAALVTFPPDSSRHLIIICLSTFSI